MTPQIFGVRHLSPAAAHHLQRYLSKKQPKCILIEGPSDATDLIDHIIKPEVRLPIAIMAYTQAFPMESILYPLADYSPEYQAMRWGKAHDCDVAFFDLPSESSLKFRQLMREAQSLSHDQSDDNDAMDFYQHQKMLYDTIAQLSDEQDYDSYFERNFEQTADDDAYQAAMLYQSEQIRALTEKQEHHAKPLDHAYNHIREAYMHQTVLRIQKEKGYHLDDIVMLVGAYHVSGLQRLFAAPNVEAMPPLPKVAIKQTLMPYSYLRLSSRTGYGAGNRAPYYFGMLWQALQNGTQAELSATYLTHIAHHLRDEGHNASSASVIEAVRLANALTMLKGGQYPVLSDLHEAAMTCLGEGEIAKVAVALNRVDIGTDMGFLPEGVGQTPIQEDMAEQLKRLKLKEYQNTVQKTLALDLRENIRVKSEAAAFLDLHRSTFLHRLQVLNVPFATQMRLTQDNASWSEKWVLQWSTEVEITIIESNLKGETIEIAAAYELQQRLENCDNISAAAHIIRAICECDLTHMFDSAIAALQALLVDNEDFDAISDACFALSHLYQFGSLRRIDTATLKPIIEQLFLRASLLLPDAATCDYIAAKKVASSIQMLERVAHDLYEWLNVPLWQAQLRILAMEDHHNTYLSGTAFALLLEHQLVSEEACSIEVARRFSPGVPADLAATWFEGLAACNRYALLSRIAIWRELNDYVTQLDEEDFQRAVVFLRRTLGQFEPSQKASIVDLLNDFWGTNAAATAEFLQTELSTEEHDALDALNDFDFDF
ncbi:hypothetical protein J7552_07505 [Wohlfahrtiimonas chitiniclastica]|uniref:DUF5682 family protein n=1 Tax=Wohlfahrtiimonas chitiniclastica TaxID=400946 RepID=UPI001BCCE556|nr:DUF5682 family protein [Wohlfahrtiimonas chitiniclastica]MBS7821129.1 hypothetical protein [Wohlfahrtiimonas chitiniclastica]